MLKKISAKFDNVKALVADDYFVNLELLTQMLKIMNIDADSANDGMEALQLYEKNEYDIIFLDIQMPEYDGYEVTQKIREAEQNKKDKTIIVAITANAMDGDKNKCLAVGMNDYISKPVRGENLENVLSKYFTNQN